MQEQQSESSKVCVCSGKQEGNQLGTRSACSGPVSCAHPVPFHVFAHTCLIRFLSKKPHLAPCSPSCLNSEIESFCLFLGSYAGLHADLLSHTSVSHT